MALCFIYLLIILHLPVNISTISLLVISFLVGLTVDMFYDTGGIHAVGTTFIGFFSTYLVTNHQSNRWIRRRNFPYPSGNGDRLVFDLYCSYDILIFSFVFHSRSMGNHGCFQYPKQKLFFLHFNGAFGYTCTSVVL